ncbi:MAG: translation elongation factor Ts [Actinomycetota bacterium]|nr:translation elongation factor Ts [Actinomycetota bacterium]MDI6822558.1 translation elongation factor Ts [Actinomycetota bacterium]
MPVSTLKIKQLRELTGAGMMDCKKALMEAKGDIETATQILRKKGLADLKKRAERIAKEGLIDAYIHAGKIGVLVEINCETDFVAKNEKFRKFAHDIAMHIAATNPTYISRDQVPSKLIEKEREIYHTQVKGKPDKVVDRIVQGRLEKFFESTCLLEQPFIKNPDITIEDLLADLVTKIGENIVIRRFVRFALGETIS